MSLIHNPANGSKIPAFVFEGNLVHKIDDEDVALEVGGILQCSDPLGKFMTDRWGFLEEVTPERALEIKEEISKVNCPHCEFKFKEQAVLDLHISKVHPKVESKKEEVIPGISQIATTPVEARINTQEATQDVDNMSGSDWYGAGLTEERRAL